MKVYDPVKNIMVDAITQDAIGKPKWHTPYHDENYVGNMYYNEKENWLIKVLSRTNKKYIIKMIYSPMGDAQRFSIDIESKGDDSVGKDEVRYWGKIYKRVNAIPSNIPKNKVKDFCCRG